MTGRVIHMNGAYCQIFWSENAGAGCVPSLVIAVRRCTMFEIGISRMVAVA